MIQLTTKQRESLLELLSEYDGDRIPSVRKITQWFYDMDSRIKNGFFVRGLLEKSDTMVTIDKERTSGYRHHSKSMYVTGIQFSKDGIKFIKELRKEISL